MAAKNSFHEWDEKAIESALQEMDCEDSVPPFLAGISASLLSKDRTTEKPTQQECLKSLQSTKFQIFNDPIHGTIELHPLLAAIVNLPAFTRLKNIRQLGGVYYVYQGATHTRFEHSIGTCYIAGEFIQMLQRKQPELHISDKEALCVEIAALCHDLGHGPFSHLFEKQVLKKLQDGEKLKDFPEHEQISAFMFEYQIYLTHERLFNDYGINYEDVKFIKELINHSFKEGSPKLKKSRRRFLYEIVANKHTGIDVDKWDYFARDCHYMGIQTEFNWRRLMAVSRVIEVQEEQRLCYRDKAVNNIYGMFRTRCSLHQKAYQHKAVIAAEHMIARAIYLVKDLPLIKPWPKENKSAEVKISSKTKPISVTTALEWVTKSPTELEGYLALNDSIVHLILHCGENLRETDKKKLSEAQTLLKQLDERELFRLIESDVSEFDISEEVIVKCCAPHDDLPVTVDDVYLRPVTISYASEKNDQGILDDPVKDTYFYTKTKPWQAIKGDDPKIKKSELVCPQKFVTKETRLYSSPSTCEKVSDAYKKMSRIASSTSDSGSSPRLSSMSTPKQEASYPKTVHETPTREDAMLNDNPKRKVKRCLNIEMSTKGQEHQAKKPKF